MRTTQPSGDGFEQRLAREYRDLAIFEADEMGDWPDAEYFAAKSLRAGGGDVPMPAEASERSIRNAATRSELDTARSDLVGVLQDGRGRAPVEAAVAQARYDCWVEQEEEGHQFDHIAACRSSYMAAMEALRGAMQPTTTTYETVQEEIARDTVYFDWDSDTIRPDQQAELDRFLDEMRKIEPVVLYIEGHTDTSGSADYNDELSRRRAEAVRAELVRQGMTVGEIKDLQLAAKGQTDLAVPTGDNVREERNRRVVLIATGTTTRTGQTTSNVQGAAPARQ